MKPIVFQLDTENFLECEHNQFTEIAVWDSENNNWELCRVEDLKQNDYYILIKSETQNETNNIS